MKYRTKLYLGFIGLLVTTTLVGSILIYIETKKVLLSNLRSEVKSVVGTAALFIDPEVVRQVQREGEVNTPLHHNLTRLLKKIRDVNRRPNFYIITTYIIGVNPENRQELVVISDADADPETRASTGEAYPEGKKIGILHHLHEIWATPMIVSDRWETFLGGYAPIYDESGNYVGTFGANISAHFIFDHLAHLRAIIFSMFAISLILGVIVSMIFSHFVSKSLHYVVEGVGKIAKGDFQNPIQIKTKDEFGELALAINEMARGLEERERLKLNFVRYVSQHVMEKILSAEKMPILKGEKKVITVFFSDIRKFSTLAEELSPEQVVLTLNEYLDKMLEVVFANNGTLDKFMGDGLMIEFGAPLEEPDQEKKAVKTAYDMLNALNELNQKWAKENRPQFEIGIGIHTGPAILGNIGSEKRMEYTAIGDTVNIAFRLEQATKDFKVPILISETTAEKIKDIYQLKDLGEISLEGRKKTIKVFEIVSKK